MDSNIFPNPHLFEPRRWIEAANANDPLGGFLAAFSKGGRVLAISKSCCFSLLTHKKLHLMVFLGSH